MKKYFLACLVFLLLVCSGCSPDSKNNVPPSPTPLSGKIDDAYLNILAGKTFQASAGQNITFYDSGYATYDYRNGVGENHHYLYRVTVVNSTDTQIDMLLETCLEDSEVFYQRDYIDVGPEPATYFIESNSLEYYQPYTCLADPRDATFFSNTYGDFRTVCAQEGCYMYIAPNGHTKYCVEHTGSCEWCERFVDPDQRYCPDCPHCWKCKKKLPPDSPRICDACAAKNNPDPRDGSNGRCGLCNGTGSVKYYYGSSDLEAYFNGQRPYTYGTCGSCGGSGTR